MANYVYAYGINNAGLVVGSFGPESSPYPTTSFLLSADAGLKYIQYGYITCAQGINDAGTIVGYHYDGNHPFSAQGFVRSVDGRYTTINVPETIDPNVEYTYP